MSLWRRAMVYLGLQDDEEFEDYAHSHQYDDEYESYDQYSDENVGRAPTPRVAAAVPGDRGERVSSEPADPRVSRGPALRDPVGVEAAPSVRPLPRDQASGESSAVRPIPSSGGGGVAPVHVVEPDGFNDAQEVGDRLKGHQAVVLNLRSVSRELQRRLIDFSSGLAYGTGGSMSRVDDQVFLLAPSGVEVSQEEKDRLQARDYRA
jgi:cell division inhibitor SepF